MKISLNNCIIHALKIENGELGFAVTMPLESQEPIVVCELGEMAGTEEYVTIALARIGKDGDVSK